MSVARRRIILYFIFYLLLGNWAGSLAAAVEQPPAVADTRILIDISGSMKKNDPQNLRQPALRLLVGLLPAESRAGVWTFGQYVNMQVPLGKVDRGWQAKARAGAGKIHSRGLFTNIEEALRRATDDWRETQLKYQRHLVLLTDGVVDVSKNPTESAASRTRILEQLLPVLQKQQARVHTIALSDRADHELLRTLSGETGGWYEKVQQAAQLQRVFLRIFEKVGQPDTVPLKDNKFRIDGSIDEATLLVFRAGDAPPTRVLPPAGEAITADAAPANVRWHRDEGYDLITITKPEPGEWRVQAAVDPDNRVVVVTDLKMRASQTPNRMLLGEQLPLHIEFTENGARIVEKAFLELVSLQGETLDSDGASEPRPIRDDGLAGDEQSADGSFTWLLGDGLAAGRVELVINAEGKTFQRQQRRLLELAAPVTMDVERGGADAATTIKLRLSPDLELLQADSVDFQALLVSGGGEQQPLQLQRSAQGTTWNAEVDAASLTGSWLLGVKLSAAAVSGNKVDFDLEPVEILGTGEPQTETVPETAPEETQPVQADIPPAPQEEQWAMQATMFGAGNLVALVLGAGAFIVIRRRQAKDRVKLVEDEDEGENKNKKKSDNTTVEKTGEEGKEAAADE